MERAEWFRRPYRVKRITAAVALVVLVTACGSSSRSSPGTSIPRTTTTPPTTVADPDGAAAHAEETTGTFPGFLPSHGWETVATPETFSAIAANIALGPGTLAGDMPWDTVGRLEAGDVVLLAMFIAPRESWADDVFPPRALPLSLDDAERDIGFEGQPDHIYADRLSAMVNGWAIDLLVFYGGGDPAAVPPVRAPPSEEARRAAQEQLERLAVPARRTDA